MSDVTMAQFFYKIDWLYMTQIWVLTQTETMISDVPGLVLARVPRGAAGIQDITFGIRSFCGST